MLGFDSQSILSRTATSLDWRGSLLPSLSTGVAPFSTTELGVLFL